MASLFQFARRILAAGASPPTAACWLALAAAGLLAPAASAQTEPHIEFVPPTVKIEPGKKVTVRAVVTGADGVPVSDVVVQWRVADKKNEDFVSLGQTVNQPTRNEVTIFGLSAAPGVTPPKLVPVVVSSGSLSNVLVVEYKAKESAEVKIAYDGPADPAPAVAPGGRTTLKVKVTDDAGKELPDAAVAWELPENVKDFAALGPVDDKRPHEVTLYGLSSGKVPRPLSIPVVARFGNASTLIDVSYTAALEPVVPVQIIWDVLPQHIVSDNFGRSIKKEFYCIEVTIRNNTGGDLQVAGLAFDLNKGEQGLVPVTSYPVVQGVLAKRKLAHPRTMALSGISAFGQLLTGFNPFFHNINHAKNFSVGIDIISNPLAKGLESVWKDPVPDEANRLDQQALRDDRIIASNQILKTRVFFPKDALFEHNADGRDEVPSVRQRLGKLVLVGYKILRSEAVTFSR
ncbi:MAG TPA: hypothetical protein VF659_00150 [Pyrinomonadaceae bacterium]|jgi:hypothetical protein